jgi:hypothetical protein
MLQPVDLDSDVVQDAQAADSFNELFVLEGMRRASVRTPAIPGLPSGSS